VNKTLLTASVYYLGYMGDLVLSCYMYWITSWFRRYI